MKKVFSFLTALISVLSLNLVATAREGDATVTYSPSLTVVEGDQPLHRVVTISITSPSNLTPGVTVPITPIATILAKPSASVSDTVALSYVTFTPATLDFTQPNQTINLTVTVDVPSGSVAGGYAWRIETPGWAAGTLDPWAFLNATVYPEVAGGPPAITLNTPADQEVFVYEPAVGPLSIPFNFTASAPSVSPITNLDANLEGVGGSSMPLTFTRTNNADGSITGAGAMTITAPGIYTVRVRATNNYGISSDAAEYTVNVSAPPPVVTIAQPTNTSYTMVAGTALSVPYSFTAKSYYGGITTLTATLNGENVSFTPTGLNTLTASGTGNFTITAAGTYTLSVTGTDANGSDTQTTTFTVKSITPAPTITIAQPVNGTVITRNAGSPATSVPFSFTAQANTGFVISAVTATLNGTPVSFTTSGLNTLTTTGTGTLSITTPGTYTLSATGTSSGVVASASTTFTVKEVTTPPPTCDVIWLPPINLNKCQQGGSVLPIKFKICCDSHGRVCENGHWNNCGNRYGWGRDCDDNIHDKCKGDRDTSVVIAVYEIYSNGSVSAATLFPYDRYSPNPPTYTIQGGNMYHLNYPTSRGVHRYKVEVYRTPTSSTTPQLLCTKEFTTK